MKRRWLIRSLFMLAVLLCVAGWGWSRTDVCIISYSQNGHLVWCESKAGVVRLGRGWLSSFTHGWAWQSDPVDPPQFLPPFRDRYQFLGFGFRREVIANPNDAGKIVFSTTYVDVPYWFFALLFSVALLFVWRKTRPRNPATAFPVEAKSQGA